MHSRHFRLRIRRLGLLLAATLSWIVHASALNLARDALWSVVQTCVAAKQTIGVPLPCLDVVDATPDHPGVAIVPSPWNATHILVVPTARIIGIEAALQQPGAQTYWQAAVAARHFVTEASDGRVPPDHVGLAINSKGSRTQDQLHIHLDCVDPAVLTFVRDQDRAITSAWKLLPAWLKGTRWFALRLKAADLGSVD